MAKHLLSVLLIISLVFIFVYSCEKSNNAIRDELKKIEGNLGKKVIIKNDTLLIIDYSLFDNTYTLSNGVKISIDFTKNSKLIN